MTIEWSINTAIIHHLKPTVKKTMANNRLLRWNSCDKKKTTFGMNLPCKISPAPPSARTFEKRHTSAMADAHAKVKKETYKDVIWIVVTCSCWTTVAYSWIMNWGADSRLAWKLADAKSVDNWCWIFLLQSSSKFSCHNFLKFLKHKINVLNRI